MQNKYIVIDLETTGNSPEKGDEIIQIAAVQIENKQITKKYTSFVQPSLAIPAFIQELTNIDEEMVAHAPLLSDAIAPVHEMLEGAYFVAHNVKFDLSFLNEAFVQIGRTPFKGPVMDTVELARIVYPSSDSYQLNDLALQMGFPHDRPHRADSDAEVTANLLLQMTEKLSSLPKITLETLMDQSEHLKSNLQHLLAQIILEKERSSDKLAEGLETFGGLVFTKAPLAIADSVAKTTAKEYPQSTKEKIRTFQAAIPAYSTRLGQFEMMDTVHDAFLHQKHAIIEAGTGIGKSLAYLLPASYLAQESKSQVIVSTYTTLLQEQLLDKEIPLLQKMIDYPIKAVSLKGRSHYISLEKFAQSLRERVDNYDTNITKMQILVWLIETKTGDVDELNLSSGGILYWNKIKCDDMTFLKNNRWKMYDFYERAKREVASAQIIITNHALLGTQLQSNDNERVIPATDYIVIDEAHNFAKAVSRQIGFKLDYISIRLLLGKLGTFEKGQLLGYLERMIQRNYLQEKLTCSTENISEQITNLSFEADEFFGILQAYLVKETGNRANQDDRYSLQFKKEGAQAVVMAAERYYFLLKDVTVCVAKRLRIIRESDVSLKTAEKYQLEKIATIVEEIRQMSDTVKQLFMKESAGYITWLEMNKRAGQQSLVAYGEPLDIALPLKKHLFEKAKSVILTSATLTVHDSFAYIVEQLGLRLFNPKLLQVASPFAYEEQVRLLIPNDIPEVNKVSVDVYVAALAEYIISIAEATKGRLLILFTSHRMLKDTYQLIKESGFLADYIMIAQGVTSGSRTRLMRNFQRFERAILFGTNSFWEGIDVPGEDLSCLIIVRLPFSHPEEPVFQAKAQMLEEKGRNAFEELSLPEAVLRFKQGFGRLIRTETDRGIIIVFDRRMITKKYGSAFLQSIPKIRVETGSISDIVEQTEKWL